MFDTSVSWRTSTAVDPDCHHSNLPCSFWSLTGCDRWLPVDRAQHVVVKGHGTVAVSEKELVDSEVWVLKAGSLIGYNTSCEMQ